MTIEQNDPIPIQIHARLVYFTFVDCQIGRVRVTPCWRCKAESISWIHRFELTENCWNFPFIFLHLFLGWFSPAMETRALLCRATCYLNL